MADSLAALVVSVFVLRVGAGLIWSSFKELSDTAPDQELLSQLMATARQIDGVRQVHDLRARYSGPFIFVELDIVVDPSISVSRGHAIASHVKQRLIDKYDDVTRVKIHVDPMLKKE